MVTGAGGALGRALVVRLGAAGHRVAAVGREAETSGSWPGAAVREVAPDLSKPEAVEALFARLELQGELGAVVNAVGAFRGGAVADGDPEGYREMVSANLDPAWWISRAAARRMADGAGGAIVHVGSRSAVAGGAGAAAYAVTKAAVVRLTEVLALELAPRRIRVNAVLPGLIDTPANRRVMSPAQMEDAVPAAAIAAVVAFLLSDEGWPVSGAALPVFGWS